MTLPCEKVHSVWSSIHLTVGMDTVSLQSHFSPVVFLAKRTDGSTESLVHCCFLCLESCSAGHVSNPSYCIRAGLTFHLPRCPPYPHPYPSLLGWTWWLVCVSPQPQGTPLQHSSYCEYLDLQIDCKFAEGKNWVLFICIIINSSMLSR